MAPCCPAPEAGGGLLLKPSQRWHQGSNELCDPIDRTHSAQPQQGQSAQHCCFHTSTARCPRAPGHGGAMPASALCNIHGQGGVGSADKFRRVEGIWSLTTNEHKQEGETCSLEVHFLPVNGLELTTQTAFACRRSVIYIRHFHDNLLGYPAIRGSLQLPGLTRQQRSGPAGHSGLCSLDATDGCFKKPNNSKHKPHRHSRMSTGSFYDSAAMN